jgi:hypothetical protein
VIPESLLDDDETIEIESVSWAESNLRLSLKFLSDDTRWLITCTGASSWRIQDRIAGGLQLSEDDPVLWR